LNWCIEGLKKYYTEGTNPPECVKSATDTYRQNSDKIGSFIEECLEKKDICNLTVKETYDTYRRWCSANGFRTEGKTVFKELLSSKVPVLERGTVRGKTCFNVVNGFTFTQEGMELSTSNY
jgi:phage/plasmid-associated DNA primase